MNEHEIIDGMIHEIGHLKAEVARLSIVCIDGIVDKNNAYTERNRLVALLARMFPSGLAKTDIPGWDKEWHNCVYIDTPDGQMSWHYHDQDAHLFEGLPPYQGKWDGHTTEQKYERLHAVALGCAAAVTEYNERETFVQAMLAEHEPPPESGVIVMVISPGGEPDETVH